jgi:anthranilate synthase/aminodeoxychorismate synthase-like glutamine amidotransferase
VSVEAIQKFGSAEIPVFGVCLGLQSISVAFGGEIVRADRLMHGKTSLLQHDNQTLFAGLPAPFEAGRYHSLIAAPTSLPAVLQVSAQTDREEIMGVRHRHLPIEGVQFHPESILTPDGNKLMANFMRSRAS